MQKQEEDIYKEKIAAQVQQQRAEIERLKAKIKEMKTDVSAAYQENLDLLEKQQVELEEVFEQLVDSSGEAWHDVKSGFLTAWEKVSDSLEKAKNNF